MHITARGGRRQLMAEILLSTTIDGRRAARPRRCGGRAPRCTADPQLVEAQLASAWASVSLSDDEFAMSTVALITALDLPGDRGTFVRGELAMIRAHVARRRGDMLRSLRDVREGVECARALPEDYQTPYRGALPGALHLHVGVAAVWAGQLDEAVASSPMHSGRRTGLDRRCRRSTGISPSRSGCSATRPPTPMPKWRSPTFVTICSAPPISPRCAWV